MTENTSNKNVLLGEALLKQRCVQESVQSGRNDERAASDEARRPNSEKNRGGQLATRSSTPITHTPRHYHTRSLKREGDTAKPTPLAGRSKCILKRGSSCRDTTTIPDGRPETPERDQKSIGKVSRKWCFSALYPP